MPRRRFGLRARFLAAGGLLVLTTVAAGAWTWFVLSGLAAIGETAVLDADEATAAAAAVASALEREDDALLFVLGGAPRGRESLAAARATTDRATALLATELGTDAARADPIPDLVRRYRGEVDAIVQDPGPEPLERYYLQANPRLREAVTAVRQARDRRIDAARAATERARDEVQRARGVVLGISLLALAVAVAIALRLAARVIAPLRQLAAGAAAIRDGDFGARVLVPARDELGQVADAFNAMAARLAEFHRTNLAEVMHAKQLLEATLRALPDAIVIVDDEGRVAALNPAAEALFRGAGHPAPARVQDLAALAPASLRLQDLLQRQPSPERVDLQAALRIQVGGEPRRVLPRVVPLAPGQAGGELLVVLSDVTEIARLDEMRTELVAVASHELRTPVTTLRMSLLMLRERAEQLDPLARELVANALGGVEQLAATVDELLDVTRIEAGKLRLAVEPVDLGEAAEEVVARARSWADELGVAVRLRRGDRPWVVVADRARLRIVLDNILGNALKYTPRGGAIDLEFGVVEGGGQAARIALAVTDSGPGVPPEFRERVFEKFFRVEHCRPGSEEAPRGSGIGLYLCKEIVELHGGTIRCEAAPGERGARFVVELPGAATVTEMSAPAAAG